MNTNYRNVISQNPIVIDEEQVEFLEATTIFYAGL